MVMGMDSDLLYPLHEQEEVSTVRVVAHESLSLCVLAPVNACSPLLLHPAPDHTLPPSLPLMLSISTTACGWDPELQVPHSEDRRWARWVPLRAGPSRQPHRRLPATQQIDLVKSSYAKLGQV